MSDAFTKGMLSARTIAKNSKSATVLYPPSGELYVPPGEKASCGELRVAMSDFLVTTTGK